ncbi:MAG: FHA domain-containing protein [Anaerolineales bacterium]
MTLVQVSVNVPALGRELDIEVADDLPVGRLAQILAEELVPGIDAEGAVLSLGSIQKELPSLCSLAELQLWSGSALVLHLAPVHGGAELIGPSGRHYPLSALGATVGRSDASSGFADIDLSQEPGGMTVSRQHARIFQHDGHWEVVHFPDATNATVVDGRVVQAGQPQSIEDGMIVEFGRVALTFHTPKGQTSIDGKRTQTAEDAG